MHLMSPCHGFMLSLEDHGSSLSFADPAHIAAANSGIRRLLAAFVEHLLLPFIDHFQFSHLTASTVNHVFMNSSRQLDGVNIQAVSALLWLYRG